MLKKGDKIPLLSLQDQHDRTVSLASFIGQPLVIYFYPKNNTPGCTIEACSFRDHYQEFKDLGAEVIGISGDSVSSHFNVEKKRKIPYILLSDRKRLAEKAFGVPRNLFGLIPGRVTFIIDKDGFIIDSFNSASRPHQHILVALKTLKDVQ